ncbi:unnamed protein product [Paramecium octaurelia]|uniref:Tetratricopeptide repeat protein n=1 Tax=Paramecium octaurelia TaxID=43137 RepID=A0A8S1TVK4_PAROT|nr:unnamed protein product [Paramecium octaurelia]
MNRFEEALDNDDSAIQKYPEDSKYYSNKATTLDKMNRFEEALENYDSAIQKKSENSDFYYGKDLRKLWKFMIQQFRKTQKILTFIMAKVQLTIDDFVAITSFYHLYQILFEKMNRFEDAFENYDLGIQLSLDQNVKAHTLLKTPTTPETIENKFNQLCTLQ